LNVFLNAEIFLIIFEKTSAIMRVNHYLSLIRQIMAIIKKMVLRL